MPSPTMAATPPAARAETMASSLFAGVAPDRMCSSPTRAPTAPAGAAPSPVSSTMCSTRARRRRRMVRAASGRGRSASTMPPAVLPSISTSTTMPSSRAARRVARSQMGSSSSIQPGPPTRTVRPSTVPVTPAPGASSRSRATGRANPRSAAARCRAAATTWDEPWSTAAASARSSSSPMPSAVITDVTSGRPAVIVPVLSRKTVSTWPSRSSVPPPRTTTPRRAARDRPDVTAIGTARIKGHGVATTSTATARSSWPVATHATAARATPTPRNPTASRSARRTMGAVAALARRAISTIPAYVLSAAVAVARRSNGAPALIDPLGTSPPAAA